MLDRVNSYRFPCAHALRAALGAAAALILSGCAVVANVPPGTSETDLFARYGKPNATHPLPDGGFNAEYSQQPLGQFVWMVHVRDHQVVEVRQVLTDREFATIKVGVDTQATILAHFGTPAEDVPIVLAKRRAWSYRMKIDGGVFPALMTVQFDEGGIVREVFSGFDPMYSGGGNGAGGGQR